MTDLWNILTVRPRHAAGLEAIVARLEAAGYEAWWPWFQHSIIRRVRANNPERQRQRMTMRLPVFPGYLMVQAPAPVYEISNADDIFAPITADGRPAVTATEAIMRAIAHADRLERTGGKLAIEAGDTVRILSGHGKGQTFTAEGIDNRIVRGVMETMGHVKIDIGRVELARRFSDAIKKH